MSSVRKLKEVNPITEEVKNGFDSLFAKIGEDTSSLDGWVGQFDELTKSCGVTDTKFQAFLETTQKSGTVYTSSQQALAGYQAYLVSSGKAATVASLKTKALSVSMKVLSTIGWMALFTLVAKGIQLAATAIDDYIHRLDNAKDALSETQSEIESTKSEIEETAKQIKELEALDPSSLSITDKEDLQRLKDQNEELRIRQQYLAQQEKSDLQKVADLTKEKYNQSYSGGVDRDNIDSYKDLYNKKPVANKLPSYLTGESSAQITPYAVSAQNNELSQSSEALANLIAQYEHFSEEKKKAIENKDAESIEKYNVKLEETALKLREDRTELQGFSDDLSATGEASPELDEITSKLKLIDNLLLSPGQNLVDFINTDSLSDNKEKLVELASTGKLTQEELSKNFTEVDKYLKENGLTLEDLISVVKVYKDELATVDSDITPILSISSTIDQLNTQLKPAFDSLKTSYQDIFTSDGFTLENVNLDMLSNVQSVMNEMKEAGLGIDTSGFENLAKVLSNSSSTAEQVQGAFDSLASSILNNTDTIKNLDESTAGLVASMLESLGVANAEEIVYDSLNAKTEGLALQKQFAAETGYKLVNATTDEITAFLNHAGASDVAKQYLFQLITAEQVFINQDLSVEDKIAKLKELATAYGQTAIAARISNMEKANTDGHVSIDYAKELSSLQNEINGAINNVKVDFKGIGGGKKSAGKAGKETADAYLDAYKKELSELDHLHEIGIISEREYLNRLNALNEKYFNDNAEHQKKYLSEYQSNQEKVYKGLQSLYKELLNDKKDGYDSALSAINKFYDGEINKLNNLKDASKDSYQSQIDDIDKKISRLEKERDTRKKAIQDQIDAIKEENEELDRQKALEDALYEAKRAQTQKSRVYKNGQVEYDTDSKAISKTADAVDKTKDDIKLAELEKELNSLDDYYDNLISNLEFQQDALKEKMDAVTASYEAQIKQLEANQQKYADIATAQEDSENKMMATALLGSNWQQLILSGRLDVLDAFKGSYLGICDEINNADATFGLDASTAAEGYAQSITDMLTRTTSLETLLQSWKDLNTGLSGVIGVGGTSSVGDTSKNGQSTGNKTDNKSGTPSTSGTSGADTITGAVQSGGIQIADTLTNQWVPAWQDVGNNMNTICGDIVTCVNEMASATVIACQQAIAAINMANTAKNSSSISNPTPGSFSGKSYQGKAYGNGTDNAKRGINLIGEDGYELYADNNGNVSLATEPTLVKMQGGEKVTNNEDTKKVLSGTGTKSPGINQEALKKLFESCGEPDENGMIMLKPLATPVLSEQIKNMSSLYNPSAMAMQSFMPKLPDYSNIATARSQEVTVHQDINVTIPNLDGKAAFHKFERGLDQMKMDAIQRSYRR